METVKLKHELSDLKGTISHIRVDLDEIDSKLLLIERELSESPEEEFKREFPESDLGRELFNLVGVIPEMSLNEEKKSIKEVIYSRFRA